MDLVAGDAPDILMVIGLDDLAALDDQRRFPAHLALGSGLDPTWLDLFAEAARSVTGSNEPADFIDARLELNGSDEADDRTIERVDPSWISTVARIPDHDLGRDRGALDRSGRGRAGPAAARGEALDPRARRPPRGVLPGGGSCAGRAVRLVDPLRP